MNILTKEEVLETQARQLANWKKLLKPKVYLALEIYAHKHNDDSDTFHCVLRGTSLDNFVSNYLYYVEKDELKDKLGKFGYERYLSPAGAHKKIKKEPTTVVEWIKTLNTTYKRQALINTPIERLNLKADSNYKAIICAFHWSDSLEGFDYWHDYYMSLGGD